MPPSKVPKGKGKGKGKGKAKAGPEIEIAREPQPCDMIHETAAAAAIESGDVAKVCKFLQQLFPEGAKRGGPELKCMRRAVSLLDTRWKAEVDKKRKATFSSEDKGLVDAVLMGGCYLPADTFANVVEYLDHATALRSTPCSRSWWRQISGLPPASHLDTKLGKRMSWSDVVTQLKNIRASNPRRSVTRLTLGGRLNLGSFANLAQAAGPQVLLHLDLKDCKGVRKIDFNAMARALPNLKGLVVEELFWSTDQVFGWLRQLTTFVRTVKLESLDLKAKEFTSSADSGNYTYESVITDAVLEGLAYGKLPPLYWFSTGGGGGGSGSGGRGDGPSTLRKLRLSADIVGPRITAGMAAIGGNMPHLEGLVVNRLKITDDGWRRFAIARADAATASSENGNGGGGGSGDRGRGRSRLRYIVITTNGKETVPAAATRGLLEDTVSKNVTLFLDSRCKGAAGGGRAAGGGGGDSSSGGNVSGDEQQFVDCEGAPIEISDKKDFSTTKTYVRQCYLW